MKFKKPKVLVRTAVAAVALLGLPIMGAFQAEAGPIALQLSSGATTVTIADDSAGDLLSSVAGAITYYGSIGNFSLNVTTGTGGTVNSAPYPHLDLNSINVNGGAGTLTIMLTEVDLSGTGVLPFLTQFGGVSSGNVTVNTFVDLGNAAFGTATQVGSTGTQGPGPFSASDFHSTAVDSAYSATIIWTLTLSAPGSSSGNAEFWQVPEPLSLSLLGAGLLILGFAARRRQGAPPPAAA